MNVTRFEDLIAWQRSRELFKLTQKVTSQILQGLIGSIKTSLMKGRKFREES